jgi:tellurite resistance protein TehA-like permease
VNGSLDLVLSANARACARVQAPQISELLPIYFFGLSPISAELSLINFYADYALALGIGVVLGYRLYTKEISPREINYAIIIPPVSIGTSIFLATPLAQYYGAAQGGTIGFLVLMGFGIFFLLYVIIGALALSGHVTTKSHETLPTTMLPVGVASLTILNLFALPYLGSFIHVDIALSSVYVLSVMFWGFELWNFLVVAIIIVTRPGWGTLGTWAYGFPLGLFATSTLRLAQYSGLYPLAWVFWFALVAITVLWCYAAVNTYVFTRSKLRSLRNLAQTSRGGPSAGH